MSVRVGQHSVGFGRFRAPQRNLQRINGLADPAVPQMNASEQQMRGGEVRREIERPIELGGRFPIAFLLEQAPRAIQIERGKLLLIPLPGLRNLRVDPPGVRPGSSG